MQLGYAEEREQPNHIEAISIFNGIFGYIDVIGNYCTKTFPELDTGLQIGKKKFTVLHSKHIRQVKKIDSTIMRIIAEKHGEAEIKEYKKHTKEEYKRQNDMTLSNFTENDKAIQKQQCKNLIEALNQGLVDISVKAPKVSKMILDFKLDKEIKN